MGGADVVFLGIGQGCAQRHPGFRGTVLEFGVATIQRAGTILKQLFFQWGDRCVLGELGGEVGIVCCCGWGFVRGRRL